MEVNWCGFVFCYGQTFQDGQFIYLFILLPISALCKELKDEKVEVKYTNAAANVICSTHQSNTESVLVVCLGDHSQYKKKTKPNSLQGFSLQAPLQPNQIL